MSGTKPASMFGRMRSLIRGWFSLWVRDREFESPEAIYEQAIRGRVTQYRELKDAVAGILYMRSKLDAEITERRAEIARLHDETRRALTRSDEEACLTLISHKQVLFDDLERAEQELGAVRLQADEAKANLVRFRGEIRSLVREKGRMLATLANAKARRRLQSAMEGLSVEAEMDALEGVREQIERMSAEGELDREIGGSDLRGQLRGFRDQARRDAARSELDQLKREMASRILPAPRETALASA
ncbi:MAG: PspA/IM30 family protein [Deltaproteobacteria bacterium]|nr:PspA/IM30 family protein [Deltaproteobacteria bacterium]